MNKQEIYETMMKYEVEHGEDFVDRFDHCIVIPNYMMWCLGKGYITVETFNCWEKAKMSGDSDTDFATSIVYSDWTTYAVVYEECWTEEGREKSLKILAEFISESLIYQQRFEEFLRD